MLWGVVGGRWRRSEEGWMQAGHLQRCESGECVRGGAFSVQKAWHERPRVSMVPESGGWGAKHWAGS